MPPPANQPPSPPLHGVQCSLGTGVWGNNADAINGVSLDVNAAEGYFKAHPMLQHKHGREFGIDFVALLQTQRLFASICG